MNLFACYSGVCGRVSTGLGPICHVAPASPSSKYPAPAPPVRPAPPPPPPLLPLPPPPPLLLRAPHSSPTDHSRAVTSALTPNPNRQPRPVLRGYHSFTIQLKLSAFGVTGGAVRGCFGGGGGFLGVSRVWFCVRNGSS